MVDPYLLKKPLENAPFILYFVQCVPGRLLSPLKVQMFATVGKVPADLIHTFTVQLKQFADCIKRRKPSVSCVATVKTSNFSVAEKKKSEKRLQGFRNVFKQSSFLAYGMYRNYFRLFRFPLLRVNLRPTSTNWQRLSAGVLIRFKNRGVFLNRGSTICLFPSQRSSHKPPGHFQWSAALTFEVSGRV